MGDFDALALAGAESSVQYHPNISWNLTETCDTVLGQYLVGSLTGAVAS